MSEIGITYAYDDNGNLISKTEANRTTTYTFNKQNRLIRATISSGQDVAVEEYEYDYAGNRTAKITEGETIRYIVDTNGVLSQVLYELDGNGSLKTYYTRGTELISLERTGELRYYLFDGHGNVRVLTDENGSVTDTYDYDAFGNLTERTGETENSYLYCGEQYDANTGFYYLRARYMNPTTGTFISMDSYQGSMFDPVSLHKYLYANANPVMFIDPTGYNSTFVEYNTCLAIKKIIADAYMAATNYALTVWSQFVSALPTLMFTTTVLLADSPAFAELCMRVADGEITSQTLIDQIVQFDEQIRQWIYEARVNNSSNSGSSSNSSGSSNMTPNDPNNWNWRKKLLDLAQNPKLKNIIDQLYRWNASVGDGGTADKLKDEFIKGEPLRHLQKAQDKIIEIWRLLNDSTLSESDRKLAYKLLNDLYEAVKFVLNK